MNALFGLLLWEFSMALFAVCLHFWRKQALREQAEARGLIASVWAVVIGTALGAVPVLMLQSLLAPLELLVALGVPLCTVAACISILSDRPRLARQAKENGNAV